MTTKPELPEHVKRAQSLLADTDRYIAPGEHLISGSLALEAIAHMMMHTILDDIATTAAAAERRARFEAQGSVVLGGTGMYVKLTEDNEWESETWHFWIPIEGNEKAIRELGESIKGLREDETACKSYELDLSPVPEFEVDAVVKHGGSDTDYMPAHTKLTGTLVITEDQLAAIGNEDDPLRKGGIRDLMCVSTSP